MPTDSNPLTDDINVDLLGLLRSDPRMSISELSRRVGLSAPAVKERVTRLEEAGIIAGYRLELNPKALGFPVTAFVRIRPMPGQLPKIIALAQSMPEVSECHRITGEDCFILKVHLDALENLDVVLDRFLAFGQTTTSIIQSSPVPPRGPAIAERAETFKPLARPGRRTVP